MEEKSDSEIWVFNKIFEFKLDPSLVKTLKTGFYLMNNF